MLAPSISPYMDSQTLPLMHSTYGYPPAGHHHILSAPSPTSLPSLPSSSNPYYLYNQPNAGSLPSTPNAHIRLDDESSFTSFFDPPQPLPSAASLIPLSSSIPAPSQLYHNASLGSTFGFDAPPTSYPLTVSVSGGGGGRSLASPVLDLPLYSADYSSSSTAPYNSPVPLSTFASSLPDTSQQQPYSLALTSLGSPVSTSHYSFPTASHKRSRSDAIPTSAAAIKTEDSILSLQSFVSPINTAPSYPSFPIQSVPAMPSYNTGSPSSGGRRGADAPARVHSSASQSSHSSGGSQSEQPTAPEPPAKRSHAGPSRDAAAAGASSSTSSSSTSSSSNARPVLRTAEERSAWRKKKHREMDAWRRKKETAVVERFAVLSGQQEEKVEEKRDRVTTLEVACERYAALIEHVQAVEEELRREKERVAALAQDVGMLKMAARERDADGSSEDSNEASTDNDYETWKRARQARTATVQQQQASGSNNNTSPRNSPVSPTPSSPLADATLTTTTTSSAANSRRALVLSEALIHYHHSHILYSSLFLHSSQMMLIISTSTARFLDISESFLTRTGFQRSDIIGKIFWGPYCVLSSLQPMPPPPTASFQDRPPVLNEKGEVVPAPIGADQLASTRRAIGELWRGEKDSVSCVWRMAFKTRDFEVRTMCWMGRGSQKVKGVGRDRERIEEVPIAAGDGTGRELSVRRVVGGGGGGGGGSGVASSGSSSAEDYSEESLYEELRRMKVEDAEEVEDGDQLMPTELIMATTPQDIVPIERREMYGK